MKQYELGELLPYEQPSKYIVNSTEYDDSYPTPVLTAGKSFILGYTNETDNIFDELPVIIFDDFTTATQYVDFKFKVKSSAMKILHINTDIVLPKYIYYLLQSIHIEHSTHKRYWIQQFSKVKVDIPPIPVQEKIVSQIEESLSQLDSAVETLKKTKLQLEVYRQAVLKEAFSFESAEQIVEVSQITDSIRIGPFGTMLHKSDYVNDGIPVINPQHIKNGVIVPSSKNSISVEKAKELNNYQLKTNDIIMGRRGEMGRSAPVTENENGWICGTGSIFFRLKSGFDAVLYSKILSSPKVVHYLEENATGTTMKNLNEDIVSHIPVPYIDKSKQNKIMQYLEEQLSVCEGIETTIYQSLQQAEALRQGILRQAFEGD